MKQCLGGYGRIYRTGGDEFMAIINANDNELAEIKESFARATEEYVGKYVSAISVSCGYALKRENTGFTIEQLEKLADKDMYMAKRNYYTSNGVDRRAQHQNAYNALKALYNKILLVNLTENKYNIISMDEQEQTEDKGFSEGVFEWLENFARTGQVHSDDVDEFINHTNKEYVREVYLRF